LGLPIYPLVLADFIGERLFDYRPLALGENRGSIPLGTTKN